MYLFAFIFVFFVTFDVLATAEKSIQSSGHHQREVPDFTIISDTIQQPGQSDRTYSSRLPLPGKKLPELGAMPITSSVNPMDKIPVSLFLNKSFSSLEEFMNNLMIQNDYPYQAAGFGSFFSEKAAAGSGGVAVPANCEPQETPVELENSNDPLIVDFPRCTKVQRCGGCCQHDLLKCVPTRTEVISVNVMRARFDPETNSFQPEGLHPISIEKHLTCECVCRVKADDCSSDQIYHEDQCRCTCINEQAIKDCVGPNQLWDPQTCLCECRNSHDCSTGFFFDENTCTCKPVQEQGNSVTL